MKRTPAQQRVFAAIEGMKGGQVAYYQWRYFNAVSDANASGLCDYEQLRCQRGLPSLKVTRIAAALAPNATGKHT